MPEATDGWGFDSPSPAIRHVRHVKGMSRARYYLAKLKRAWPDGTLIERARRKAFTAGTTSIRVLTDAARLVPEDRALNLREGFADHRASAKAEKARDKSIVERVMRAYELASRDWKLAQDRYQLRGLWAEWIDLNFDGLTQAVDSEDIVRVDGLLENFARERFATGLGSSYDDLRHYRTPLVGKAYVRTVWCRYRDALADAGFDLKTLAYPKIGNPAGVPVNGSVIQIDTLRHAYSAFSIMHLLRDVNSPVILEIGGGLGGQAFQTVSQLRSSGNPAGRYFDFDIPEVQIAGGYFLIHAFPELDVRLYGEAEVEVDGADRFDIGVFPHFAIDGLEDSSVDLVFNSNSFSEMDEAAASHYLAVTDRVCRKYFLHINHEHRLRFSYPDGTTSSNLIGSEIVPDVCRFKRIYKRPRLFVRPEDKPFKSFAYLYERAEGLC